ncbi:aldehyde dehydrogenase family protein [Peribacillus glennii]|uniref:Aldehyde dehydrogenase family protein n=1 Tax=Peribacillus glennii TaxID=2303991 RepID=A0A372LF77_9BACI|nr:aldehyde dehydrogenase family protein [Peribacillus glennii]RFU64940.1 aldehyde dehydrogenase family protein [Peribacillus glennii]
MSHVITKSELKHYKLFLDGAFVDAEEGNEIEVINPADESVVGYVALATQKDAEKAVNAAKKAFESGIWSNKTPAERSKVLNSFANLIEENYEELTKLFIAETGSTVGKTEIEFKNAIDGYRTYANLVNSGYEYEAISPNSVMGIPSFNFVNRVPVGVVVGIIPWNWPLYLAMWKIAPALAAGCTIIIKAANETPLHTLEVAKLAEKAGIPSGVLQVITGDGPEVGEYLVTHPYVNKISFTGSNAVGKRIMNLASDDLKRVKLELGGKSAQIFLKDADLDIAIDGALFTGYQHNGQTCHNGTRVFVPRSIHDQVVDRLVERTKAIQVGDPSVNPNAGIGPVVSKVQYDRIKNYIAIGLQEGATIAVGGDEPQGEQFQKGFWINPTIFTNVTNDMRIAREEIFGPVIVVIPYDEIDEAIAMANDNVHGLSGNVWSKSVDRAVEVAKQMRTGMVLINDSALISNKAPFGGFKHSGIGRESGIYGLLEFTEMQHIHVGLSSDKQYYKTMFAD